MSASTKILGAAKGPLLSFWNRQTAAVRTNVKFAGAHSGDTCLIFGNGASLKFYDFSAISDEVVIACSFGLLDRRLRRLNVKYNVFSDSYLLYPLIYNDYLTRVQTNPASVVLKRLITNNPSVTFFTSITNSFSWLNTPPNVRYWHHFGHRDSSAFDLAGQFSTCTCAMDMMLGVARYMGFRRALLLGCDYLASPRMEGHFYTHRKPAYGPNDEEYVSRVRRSVGNLDVTVVCPSGVSSPFFPSVTFEECFGTRDVYQSNREIIDPVDLGLMQRTADSKLIFM